jgi:N6-L-threonylcarbamoyladenine synthase
MRLILAIETSCDETAAALVKDGSVILGSALYSQVQEHNKYGGVVPEIASRKHIETIIRIIQMAFDESSLSLHNIEGVAVTIGPGLIGSLLIGISVAKSIAFCMDIPIIPVDHLEGHIYAAFLTCPTIKFPFVSLVVSGGHTDLYLVEGHNRRYTLLGQTRDDAAGEAFDKVAKALGLGYPGGPIIDKLAREGDPRMVDFPRPYLEKGSLDFSFSGLKTSVYNSIHYEKVSQTRESGDQQWIASIAASFQEAVVDVLVAKALAALSLTGAETLALGGGVASNTRLRGKLKQACEEKGIEIVLPPPEFCVDNACMIGVAGFFNQERAAKDWSLTAYDSRQI